MHPLLLSAQAWGDAQRFDQPAWQMAEWRDQKVRHIHLHIAKALGKVVAWVDEETPMASATDLKTRVCDEVLPDVAIYRSQLINLLPDGWVLPSSLYPDHARGGTQEADPLWRVMLGLSRASAELAAYLEPREHGVETPCSHIWTAIENLHASAEALATVFEVDPARAHRNRLETLLGASLPTSVLEDGGTGRSPLEDVEP